MKKSILITATLCGLFGVRLQATNCSAITYTQTADNKTMSAPGGYVKTETRVYAWHCYNTQTGVTYITGSNSATATGSPINTGDCNPTWNVASGDPAPPAQNWFTITGQSYVASPNHTTCEPGSAQVNTVYCASQSCSTTGGGGCGGGGKEGGCQSPIILDITGQGYFLTDAERGVRFDIVGNGHPIQMGWTAPGVENAFLALPAPDGLVHNGQDLFGNNTPQPASSTPNGFAALAVYDEPEYGGNGDGILDSRDGIFIHLRLWVDKNHDGICQPEELFTLPESGINSISLNYSEDQKTDQFGNQFRYRSQLNPDKQTEAGKTSYDIFFVTLEESVVAMACSVPGH